MSTAVVSGFSSSKVQQENRLKSRKQARQSGLKPQNRQTGRISKLTISIMVEIAPCGEH